MFDLKPLELYSRRITTPGSKRNAFGELLEYFAAEALGATRTGIFTEAICPDLKLGNLPVEVKASKAGCWVIYPWRMGREKEYEKQHGIPYLYALMQYKTFPVGVGDILTCANLKECQLYLGSLSEIAELCSPLPLRTIKNTKEGCGYHREGYNEGYVELKSPAWPIIHEDTICGIPFRQYSSPGAQAILAAPTTTATPCPLPLSPTGPSFSLCG